MGSIGVLVQLGFLGGWGVKILSGLLKFVHILDEFRPYCG